MKMYQQEKQRTKILREKELFLDYELQFLEFATQEKEKKKNKVLTNQTFGLQSQTLEDLEMILNHENFNKASLLNGIMTNISV